jgi:5'-3' exonuclease
MHLVLIDLSSLWHAAWHATADQELSAAYAQTLAKVHRNIGDTEATHAAVCLDAPPYTHRKAILPTYKATRDKPPAAMLEQFDRLKARLVTDGLVLWSAEGFEADDVIATATREAVERKMEVTIVSSDKDLLQLVSDENRVRVFSPASITYYDRAKVIEKFAVAPEDILSFLALMGDKSDNVPGIPGIGPKNAARLLMTYRTFDDVFANADKETPKICESLITYAEDARKARQVIALRTDVPIRFDNIFAERKPEPLKHVTPEAGPEQGFEEEDPDFAAMISEPKPEPPPEPKNEPRPAPEPKPAGPGVKSGATEITTALEATHGALVIRSGEWSMELEPRNLKQAWWLAERIADSRLFAKFGTAAAAYMVLLRGRALGLDAIAAASAFHRIDDRLAMHADLIEALVLRSGKAEYFEIVESTRERAVYATKRIGGRREIKMQFTIEDAFHATLVVKNEKGIDGYKGLGDRPSNWDKYRATMLRHRCKTQLARAVYSDVVLGLYTPDEVADGRAAIDTEFEAA